MCMAENSDTAKEKRLRLETIYPKHSKSRALSWRWGLRLKMTAILTVAG